MEDERSDAEILADVARALEDRQEQGLSATNNMDATAPQTLDNVPQSDRKLIQDAVEDMRAVEDLEQ